MITETDMVKHRIYFLLIALLFAAASPVWSADDDAEPLPEEDTILGTWYVQFMEDEVMPLDEQLRLVLNEDGSVKLYQGEEEDESGKYTHDKQAATITIYDGRNPADIEAVLKYSFADDMLVVRYTEGPANADNEPEEVMELTRKPEGTKRHQALREKQGDQPSQKKRMLQLRQLFMGVMTYHAGLGKSPDSIGDMVVGEYLTLESAVPQSAQDKLPKDFKDWKKQAKSDWINQHTDCVYIKLILNHPQVDSSGSIAIFELPANKEQENVVMVFGDGHSEVKSYKEADRKISKQTGHTLEQWMKTTQPGSGKMVLPKKQDAGDA